MLVNCVDLWQRKVLDDESKNAVELLINWYSDDNGVLVFDAIQERMEGAVTHEKYSIVFIIFSC